MSFFSRLGPFGWYMSILVLLLAFAAFQLAMSFQSFDEAVSLSAENEANCAQLEEGLDRDDSEAVQAYESECQGTYSGVLEKARSKHSGRIDTYRTVLFGIVGLTLISWAVRRVSLRKPAG